jgi:hypothetical protein
MWARVIIAREGLTARLMLYSEHPTTSIRLLSPHSANIDSAKLEQQCGGILARAQPVCARLMEF